MDRLVLRDDQWERIAPLVPGKVGDPGGSGADASSRRFSGLLVLGRHGAIFPSISATGTFSAFADGPRFDKIFEALSADADFEYVIVDGTIVRVHQHATGAKGALRPSGAPAVA